MTQIESTSSHRILLVDDDWAMREMMKETLARKGFDVITAGSVTETLQLIVLLQNASTC